MGWSEDVTDFNSNADFLIRLRGLFEFSRAADDMQATAVPRRGRCLSFERGLRAPARRHDEGFAFLHFGSGCGKPYFN